jgi:putative endonuclease
MKRKRGFVYILMNKTRTVLYIGVISDLQRRLSEHQLGEGSAFTAKYNVKHLVYFETYHSIVKAIEREKQLKNWNRDWKLELIKSVNPDLRDLRNDIRFL